MLVDRSFIKEQFAGVEQYKKFLAEYLKTSSLPDDVMKHIVEIEK